MLLLGLTGGVGMGKSTSAQLFAQRGFALIDTDALARQVVEPGQPALIEIARVFGPEFIDVAGALRRHELASRVFANESDRRKLEAILHPRIREKWLAQVQQWRDDGVARCVVVVPLLFETSAQRHFDATICVACSASAQRARLSARGWTSEHIEQRIRAQWPIEKKIELANHVIWTEGDMAAHAAQIERLVEGFANR